MQPCWKNISKWIHSIRAACFTLVSPTRMRENTIRHVRHTRNVLAWKVTTKKTFTHSFRLESWQSSSACLNTLWNMNCWRRWVENRIGQKHITLSQGITGRKKIWQGIRLCNGRIELTQTKSRSFSSVLAAWCVWMETARWIVRCGILQHAIPGWKKSHARRFFDASSFKRFKCHKQIFRGYNGLWRSMPTSST